MNKDIKENLINIVSDTAEPVVDKYFFDEFIQNGILRDIPVLGNVVDLLKICSSVKDVIFSKKLKMFFYEESKLNDQEKERIYKKINSYKDKQSLGEEILNVIDNAESSNKARLIGYAINILQQDDIDVDFYLEFITQISRCRYKDIIYIKHFEKEDIIHYSENDIIPTHSLNQLYICGFLDDVGFDGGYIDKNTPYGKMYQINKQGIILRDILNDNNFY